ncbi:methyltransferase type 12 [Streptomyces sp. Root431]|uniref:class I SAM-dependent methyltransferase n=1 Tax=Streptomyces sp. Root431 TaxID=1736535 RepID=UPI0006F1DCA4|nr:class I SAM-dependent methyltransferase [Streptomyces sp. Root431]KQX14747.1 methyltransferase type 12 [Streptomyces sp. Root431]
MTTTTTAWRADPYTDALRTGQGPLYLSRDDGWLLPLEVERWCAAPDPADLSVLERCRGSVLDVGCGPGRLVAALAVDGRRTLGVDVSSEAVARTIGLGATALCRSVFDPLPAEGRWDTALLIDGNIGIGGDPAALLRRLRQVVSGSGRVVAECAAFDVDERCEVRVVDGRGGRGERFPWARVGVPALAAHAAAAGWALRERWERRGRRFAVLTRQPSSAPR